MKADLRIVAATNRNLIEEVQKGSIREDFFYRIHVIPIRLPPLRRRKEDIPFLVEHFLQTFDKSRRLSGLPGKVMDALYSYDWPGNVRELQNALQRYLTMGHLDFIYGERLAVEPQDDVPGRALGDTTRDLRRAVEALEREMIAKALNSARGNKSKAASILGIPRKTLFRKLQRLGQKDPSRP